MTPERLEKLLASVRAGETSVNEALERLRELPYAELGFATVDHHRELRCGAPEVVYGEGKTPAQLAEIARAIVERGTTLLVTRVDAERAQAVLAAVPDAEHDPLARTVVARRGDPPPAPPRPVLVVCAGTSDLPVAREAAVTAEALGSRTELLADVGVAGIHRLLGKSERLRAAGVVVVVAGMEGALPSVVSGLVDVPCIAVPTSVGYGASLGGLTALLGMLNSCSPGLTVVNVDNGFGAGYAAAQINRLRLRSD
ncbi:MAG: nickel pincer cofactor biosynthesis protein LarB [Planctomycetota bacterium]|nr:MAG: nickel pincer cofactor biosynthesis protein LarB [Planctomycetota bacterium]